MSSHSCNASTRVQVLLEFLHEKQLDLEEVGEIRRIRLEQAVHLGELQREANQVYATLYPTYSSDMFTTLHLLILSIHCARFNVLPGHVLDSHWQM